MTTINPVLLHRLKSSPDWQDDFRVVSEERAGGVRVYRVESDESSEEVFLKIAKLNEVLKS